MASRPIQADRYAPDLATRGMQAPLLEKSASSARTVGASGYQKRVIEPGRAGGLHRHELSATALGSEAARRGFSLTEVAAMLHTSQPGVSRQVRELEEELGVDIFVRAEQRA